MARHDKISQIFGVAALSVVLTATFSTGSEGTETTNFTYDALGRLTNTSISGGTNAGITTNTTYDAAGNRGLYKVSGASSNAPAGSRTMGAMPGGTPDGEDGGQNDFDPNDAEFLGDGSGG